MGDGIIQVAEEDDLSRVVERGEALKGSGSREEVCVKAVLSMVSNLAISTFFSYVLSNLQTCSPTLSHVPSPLSSNSPPLPPPSSQPNAEVQKSHTATINSTLAIVGSG